ncbi:hypothetical protein DUNSADRAFT_7567 [Dunaliella salina]|uniref:F-box protein Hrt3/FBXO9 C-terminal domain-containing protein n=1 Tax=Dunaliella salina TaxID=3046 RepID=A0ABQ7GL50_DUNSA|nr:hypothetical protein DUNSADRAFT_7567 [Dunaliella salina]|eukprot:KAF5835335.1 hypothetical protein DUNSADRAFT_7567 [Dunaliella salina]
MFIHHPHMRFDGLYVSRNTYIRTGQPEWVVRRSCSPVQIVVYFRYYRFFPDGTMLYCTSPINVSSVAKAMAGPLSHFQQQQQQQQHDGRRHSVFMGRWTIKGNKVWAVVRYPNSWSTEIRSRFTLRSTHVGANNRLDIESIQSYDRELRMGSSMLPAQQLEERYGIPPSNSSSSPHPEAEPGEGEAVRKQHRRGTSSAVFVPWEQVNTSVLNLPPSQMDTFIPG